MPDGVHFDPIKNAWCFWRNGTRSYRDFQTAYDAYCAANESKHGDVWRLLSALSAPTTRQMAEALTS